MIASTIPRIVARVSRWSSTGNAAARPDRSRAPLMSLGASPKYRDGAALSNPITQSGVRNHKGITHRRLLPARRATVKSP
jgi:hypothetical protein